MLPEEQSVHGSPHPLACTFSLLGASQFRETIWPCRLSPAPLSYHVYVWGHSPIPALTPQPCPILSPLTCFFRGAHAILLCPIPLLHHVCSSPAPALPACRCGWLRMLLWPSLSLGGPWLQLEDCRKCPCLGRMISQGSEGSQLPHHLLVPKALSLFQSSVLADRAGCVGEADVSPARATPQLWG